MAPLADQVLPLIRARSDLHRYAATNAYGAPRPRCSGEAEMAEHLVRVS